MVRSIPHFHIPSKSNLFLYLSFSTLPQKIFDLLSNNSLHFIQEKVHTNFSFSIVTVLLPFVMLKYYRKHDTNKLVKNFLLISRQDVFFAKHLKYFCLNLRIESYQKETPEKKELDDKLKSVQKQKLFLFQNTLFWMHHEYKKKHFSTRSCRRSSISQQRINQSFRFSFYSTH